jgi:hypothetical protein
MKIKIILLTHTHRTAHDHVLCIFHQSINHSASDRHSQRHVQTNNRSQLACERRENAQKCAPAADAALGEASASVRLMLLLFLSISLSLSLAAAAARRNSRTGTEEGVPARGGRPLVLRAGYTLFSLFFVFLFYVRKQQQPMSLTFVHWVPPRGRNAVISLARCCRCRLLCWCLRCLTADRPAERV